MKIAVAKESELGELRVAQIPDTVARLVKQGFEVLVETGAGIGAGYEDAAYTAVGAKIIDNPAQLWNEADILLKVNPPRERDGQSEVDWLKPGAILISFLNPLSNPDIAQKLAHSQTTALSMELIPRTTRAQSMDALSSQANIAGYKAVLLAAASLPQIFPMMTTAAGTIPPAKVLVLGAGVAGLQAIAAQKVAMTAMPQMVGIFNGVGGAASALVAVGEFYRVLNTTGTVPLDSTFIAILGVLIGGVTLTGSLLAFAKLQELITGSPITFPLQQPFNGFLLISFVVGSGYLLIHPENLTVFLGLTGISLLLGALFVLPIGGADMPVVVSLLNSFSGLAASAVGFILMNNMLIVAGALVGASGLILTQIMCKAMNRPLSNVLFGAFGGDSVNVAGCGSQIDKTYRSIDPEEGAMMLGYARSVVIVPGYGMAVAQAQHGVRELADQLEKMGVDVKYAIHPVAGRMPGHMNVLLAEANVVYDRLYDMDDINTDFDRIDVALVIGANDVVNPAACHDLASPIYGMPILNVDKAQHAIVIKRSMRTGFAGVDNELFYKDKTTMLFGSSQDVVSKLVAEVKQL